MAEMGGYAWRELRRRKWRTATTILGYFLAVSVIIGLTSAMSSRRKADRLLSGEGRHFLAFAPADAGPGAAPPPSCLDPENEGFIAVGNNEISTSLLSQDLLAATQDLPAVMDASPAILFRLKAPADGHTFTVVGITPPRNASGGACCATGAVTQGRAVKSKGEQAVTVEEAYAKAHHLEIGQKVSVAGTQFTMVGIIDAGTQSTKADIYMPFTEAERVVNSRMKGEQLQKRFNALLVEVRKADVQDKAMRQVKALDPSLVVSTYEPHHAAAPAAQVLGMNENAVRILVFLVAFGVILFAAKSQLASVMERRGDIVTLKAIGWSGRHVVTLLLAESVIQALIGGLLGGLAAVVGLAIFQAALPNSDPAGATEDLLMIGGVLGAAALLALLGGILAGAVPALLSARINPAEAIRKL